MPRETNKTSHCERNINFPSLRGSLQGAAPPCIRGHVVVRKRCNLQAGADSRQSVNRDRGASAAFPDRAPLGESPLSVGALCPGRRAGPGYIPAEGWGLAWRCLSLLGRVSFVKRAPYAWYCSQTLREVNYRRHLGSLAPGFDIYSVPVRISREGFVIHPW